MPKPVVIVGALDTKGPEYQFVRDLIRERGLRTIVGLWRGRRAVLTPDISNDEVARAGGSSIAELREKQDKTFAMRTMANGLAKVVTDLYEQGRLGGIFAMAGSGGVRCHHRHARASGRRAQADAFDRGGR